MFEWMSKLNRWRLSKRRFAREKKRMNAESKQQRQNARSINCQEALCIAHQNSSVFHDFKGALYLKSDVVLMASGSSLNSYIPIRGACHIGVNSLATSEKYREYLNFLFIQDFGVRRYYDDIKKLNCNKVFIGRPVSSTLFSRVIIPEFWIKELNASLYYTSYPLREFRYDIETFGLPDYGSVVFPAFSFALWLHPKRIFLVGCDCSNKYFTGEDANGSFNWLIYGWQAAKEFATQYYPDVDIISINPIGLKGLFIDKYS